MAPYLEEPRLSDSSTAHAEYTAPTIQQKSVPPSLAPPTEIEACVQMYHSCHGSLQPGVPEIASAKGNFFTLVDGGKIFDAVGGAAATSIGHCDPRVKEAVVQQLETVEYCRSTLFKTKATSELTERLVQTTEGVMKRAMILSSGTEAVEAALKLSLLYFRSIGQPQRTRFIARQCSYHGSSTTALALGHHKRRREMYKGLLAHDGNNFSHVSRAHPFRDQAPGQSNEDYVAVLAQELDDEFQAVGPGNVCAFVAEPVVGAGLAAAAPPPEYFKAMKDVCNKYGALLILDEVMCGLGRTGYYHAWQNPDIGVAPDLQTVGKTLGGAYMPIAALLIGSKVATSMEKQKEFFVHGSTYEDHPLASATALCVQSIISSERLVQNVRIQGMGMLKSLKKYLGGHPCVCNIRGLGLFWGIEFSQPGTTKPYPSQMKIAYRVRDAGLSLPVNTRNSVGFDGISLFPMQGCADGLKGDVVMLMPSYNVSYSDIATIAEAFSAAVHSVLGSAGELVAAEVDVVDNSSVVCL